MSLFVFQYRNGNFKQIFKLLMSAHLNIFKLYLKTNIQTVVVSTSLQLDIHCNFRCCYSIDVTFLLYSTNKMFKKTQKNSPNYRHHCECVNSDIRGHIQQVLYESAQWGAQRPLFQQVVSYREASTDDQESEVTGCQV